MVDSVVADKLQEFAAVLLQLILIKITTGLINDNKSDLLVKLDKGNDLDS